MFYVNWNVFLYECVQWPDEPNQTIQTLLSLHHHIKIKSQYEKERLIILLLLDFSHIIQCSHCPLRTCAKYFRNNILEKTFWHKYNKYVQSGLQDILKGFSQITALFLLWKTQDVVLEFWGKKTSFFFFILLLNFLNLKVWETLTWYNV